MLFLPPHISQNGAYCKSKKNIVFLKVHKCSSSTVQNLLFRFGDQYNLNFVMPLKGNYLGDINTEFERKNMIELPVEEYNILCHHTRFNEKSKSVFLSIVLSVSVCLSVGVCVCVRVSVCLLVLRREQAVSTL